MKCIDYGRQSNQNQIKIRKTAVSSRKKIFILKPSYFEKVGSSFAKTGSGRKTSTCFVREASPPRSDE